MITHRELRWIDAPCNPGHSSWSTSPVPRIVCDCLHFRSSIQRPTFRALGLGNLPYSKYRTSPTPRSFTTFYNPALQPPHHSPCANSRPAIRFESPLIPLLRFHHGMTLQDQQPFGVLKLQLTFSGCPSSVNMYSGWQGCSLPPIPRNAALAH